MRLFRAFFSPPEPAPPVLFRVSGPAGPPSAVEVRARWAPSGRVLSRRIATDRGLGILPWLHDATSVELSLRAGRARGTLALDREETRTGAVVEIDLEDRPSIPA